MKSAAIITLAGRPASKAEGFAKVVLDGEVVAALDAWRTFRRINGGLSIELEAGPDAFVTAERLGQANREQRLLEGFVTVAGLGSFEGVWAVPAIVHVWSEPSDMAVTLTPAPGTVVLFTPEPLVAVAVAAEVVEAAPAAEKPAKAKKTANVEPELKPEPEADAE